MRGAPFVKKEMGAPRHPFVILEVGEVARIRTVLTGKREARYM